MLGRRFAIELHSGLGVPELRTRLWGYIESRPDAGSGERSVLGGSIGEDSFTIRYACDSPRIGSVVKVAGLVRSSGGRAQLLLRLSEEPPTMWAVGGLLLGVCFALVARLTLVSWIETGITGAGFACAFLVAGRGTSPEAAQDIAEEIASVLKAEVV
jgi:hypothetical protein